PYQNVSSEGIGHYSGNTRRRIAPIWRRIRLLFRPGNETPAHAAREDEVHQRADPERQHEYRYGHPIRDVGAQNKVSGDQGEAHQRRDGERPLNPRIAVAAESDDE